MDLPSKATGNPPNFKIQIQQITVSLGLQITHLSPSEGPISKPHPLSHSQSPILQSIRSLDTISVSPSPFPLSLSLSLSIVLNLRLSFFTRQRPWQRPRNSRCRAATPST